MRYITNDEVLAEVALDDAAQVLRYAYLGLGAATTGNHSRSRTTMGDARLSTLGGILPQIGYLGSKTYASCNGANGFAIVIFSSETARMLAVLEGEAITRLKGAVTTALVAEKWARTDASSLSIFGTGVQARAHVHSLLKARPIRRVNVVSRGDASEYVGWVEKTFGIDVRQTDPAVAATAADILVTATRSSTPLFDGGLVSPGTFVAALGTSTLTARELDETLVRRADCIGVDLIGQAQVEAGDLTAGVAWDRVSELPGILYANGAVPGPDDRSIRVFKSTGSGIADVAVAVAAYARLSGNWEALNERLDAHINELLACARTNP